MTVRESGLHWLVFSVIFIALDQWTKQLVFNAMPFGASQSLLPFFNLTHVHNYGAAFGMLSEAGGWQRWFLSAIAVVVTSVIIYFLRQTPKQDKLLCFAYASVLSGAIGNVIDRLNYGFVIDFLDFYYQSWHFPAFNVADICITLGAVALFVDALFFQKEKASETES